MSKTACWTPRIVFARYQRPAAVMVAACSVLCTFLGYAADLSPSAGVPGPEWTPVFQGVELKHLVREDPEPLSAHVLRIDLAHPGIRFFVTPQNGDRPKETDGMKTTTFLKTYGCQVAVNASPYAPVGEAEGEPCDVLGLSISDGDAYSAAHGAWGALLITKENKARIATPPFDTSDVYNAVGGFHLLLENGENVGTEGEKHPRTAVGVSEDGRYLYLLVIDGRQPGRGTARQV